MQQLESNIWKFTIHSITNKRTYLTFLTIFLLTMPHATAKTIGIVTALGQFVGFLIEIPSGYISDRIGHKNALVIARLAMVLSTACYVFATSTLWFIIGGVLLAIGFAFESGTASSFMHDTLRDLGRDSQYAHIMGRIKSIGFAVPIIFIVGLPIIAEVSFRWAFGIALLIDIVGLGAVMSLYNPAVSSVIEEMSIINFKKTLIEWYHVGWVRYVVVTVIIGGISFGASAGFKNPYQELIGFSISSLGILWALSRGLISIMLLCNGWIHRTFSYKQFLIFTSLVQAGGFIIIGFFAQMWVVAVAFIMLTAFNFGLSSASEQYELDFIKTSKNKAVLLSVNSLGYQLIAGLFGLAMGFMVVGYSFQIAYMVTGSILIFVVLCSLFFYKK